MAGMSTTLAVPYFTQPTNNTCQSTVLKMFASYLEQSVVHQSTGAAARAIGDIWKDINEDPRRPVRLRNAHANMKWWLEQRFPTLRFEYLQTNREEQAIEAIVRFIDRGFPVFVSVSHARVEGHIILITGYANHRIGMSSADFEVIVHDPYGRFDPSLLSNVFGSKRWTGGRSLMSGDEAAPGRANRLRIDTVNRHRLGDAQAGMYYLLSAAR